MKYEIPGKGVYDLDAILLQGVAKKALFEPSMPPDAEEHVTAKIKERQGKLQKQMQSILTDVFMPSETKGRAETINYLAQEYILNEFGAKYDELSPQLFELKRVIKLNENSSSIKIPLFAHASLSGDGYWKIDERVEESGFGREVRTQHVTIESKMPPISREAKEKARQANADYLQACSNALREPVIGDWLLKDPNFLYIGKDFLHVYWIPTPDELKITVKTVEKDPLLVANVCGTYFLVAKWNLKGEMPFEHYLAEYKVR